MPSQGKSPRLPSGSRRLPSPRSVSTVSGRSATSDDTDDSRMGYSSSVAPSSVSSRRVPFPDSLPAAMSSANPPPELLRDSVVEQHDSNGDGRGQSESGSRSSPQLAAHAPAVPTDPMPDSLLTRSTFAALEHSAGTLKRLAKHVLASSSTMFALLEQLESAEDDLLMHLGELGRWLEGGYGVTGEVWDSDGGIRKVAREKRARDREELEVMVSHSLEAVKGEIKRQGLAGHGAQTKFESVAKQYYQNTAAYLSPAGGSSSSSPAPDAANDLAQASRTAQFDLVRYNHHSTLLYAVPPSSVGCLDLLVGLYGWVGAQLSQVPGKRADTHPFVANTDDFYNNNKPSSKEGPMTPTQRGRQLAVSETPVRILSRDDASARVSVDALARTLALSLGHLVQVRGDLLIGWAEREHQTSLLEDSARRLAEQVPESNRLHIPPTPDSAAIRDHHKPRKMHGVRSSVGGKIRGLFGSSGSGASPTAPMPTLAERAPPVSSSSVGPPPLPSASRKSVDIGSRSTPPIPSAIPHVNVETPTPPPPRPTKSSNRHSVQVPHGQYHSPFIPSEPVPRLPRSQSFGERKSYALMETAAKLNGTSPSAAPPLPLPQPQPAATNPGGVGGLNGAGDEDEQREQVGRKKEGVLWGTGVWEELDKGGGRSKWERFWVVLAHSNIYEYREKQDGTAATVIDLKFASVREGRGTDRRFAFEIVTPSHGRRLYQAASEADMRTWVYAICNAIESCINGTSTVRSSDIKDAGYVLDDHGRKKKGADGRRLPIPSPQTTGTPAMSNSRHSLPAPPRSADENARRARRPSFKSRIKNTAGAAGDKLMPNRQSLGAGSEVQRPAFLAHGGRMPSYPSMSSSDKRTSWLEESPESSEIEKRVMEMAGLGLDPRHTPATAPASSSGHHSVNNAHSREQSSSPSDSPNTLQTAEPAPKLDMKMLRQIADEGPNAVCADCGRRTKSSRWATLSEFVCWQGGLRETPMVMFLCIRCCGLHRGLGTHISKPRSVDLDNWSPESVLLAHQWGNPRGNAVWERLKPAEVVPKDEDIAEYIQAKYVEGRWLADSDRSMFGLSVGRAL